MASGEELEILAGGGERTVAESVYVMQALMGVLDAFLCRVQRDETLRVLLQVSSCGGFLNK